MDAEQLNQALYGKMEAEQERFKHNLLGLSTEEALNRAYEFTIREDILMEMEALELPADQASALLASPFPLADVYREWSKVETHHMEDIRDVIEGLADARVKDREVTRSIPLYRHSGQYAREHGELDAFRASRQANEACKEAIEAAIRNGYDGMHLNPDVKGVLAEFGSERVSYVLAATIQDKEWDERFSRENKAWAASVPMAEPQDRRCFYTVNSHSTLLNGFVGMVRKELDAMREQQANRSDGELSGLMENPHLYSTLRSGLVDSKTGEVIETLYDDAGQYQEAISHSMASFHTTEYPGNDLMQYFKLPNDPQMERSIKSKIHSAVATVEASGAKLYTRLDLSMTADLTRDELEAFTAQIESQYRDGWGAELELLTIPVGKEAVCLRLWHDEISLFSGAEAGRFEQQTGDRQDSPPPKASIRAQLAAKPVPGDQPAVKTNNREVR